jgi:hypothetical protein
MLFTTSYLDQPRISLYGLDPDTPATDYEIHLIRAADPAYVPPDSELWPLYFRAVIEILERHPAVHEEVSAALDIVCEKVKGLRALPPLPVGAPPRPNEPNPLPNRPSLGARTYPTEPAEQTQFAKTPTSRPRRSRHLKNS